MQWQCSLRFEIIYDSIVLGVILVVGLQGVSENKENMVFTMIRLKKGFCKS